LKDIKPGSSLGEPDPEGVSAVGRAAALGALTLAIVLVGLLILNGGSSYTVRADFQDAGGLVSGDEVLIGPAIVGSVTQIKLTDAGQAEVTMSLEHPASPLHAGTIAHIYQDSLSGIANRYISLDPGPSGAPKIPEGGSIGTDHTYAPVDLDQAFDTFDPATRNGLRGLVQGEAASLRARGADANRTLQYLAPSLAGTSAFTAELARDQPAFDDLLVQGAQTMQALASRSTALSDLVARTSATSAAIASRSQALRQALGLLPGTLNRSTSTFAGLRSTLDALDPLIAASKPATRQLTPFAIALRSFAAAAVPTVAQLSALIRDPRGGGDLTALALRTPALQRLAAVAFPRAIDTMNSSQRQLDSLREFTPDIVAALTNIGQDSAYYDANGHYARTQPDFFATALDQARNELVSTPGFNRLTGVLTVHGRCPGGAMQAAPDGSAPWQVPGCSLSSTPPGR
jgi:phospholipid/cholesterol/gamma-HCH transport system substrate-binding protein